MAPTNGAGARKLPVLHFGRSPLLTDRSLSRVVERLQSAVDAIVAAHDDRVYTMTPCRIGDRVGLYAKDLFERSAFRQRLARAGAEFADPAWVRLTDAGFEGAWGRIHPDFLVTADVGDDPTTVVSTAPGFLLFATLAHRLWTPPRDELPLLRNALAGVRTVGCDDPRALCRAIETE